MFKVIFLLISALLFSSCGLNEDDKTMTRAFFGDKENDRVVIVDVEKMKLNPYVNTGHAITYTADEVFGLNKAYVVNRGEEFIDVLDVNTMQITKSIELQHFPRSSEAMNTTLDLAETSGMDKVMASIIDIHSDEVVSVVGTNAKVTIPSGVHGGSHATGHPFWFDKNHFAVLDRENFQVITYYIEQLSNGNWSTTELNTLPTTTSVHQVVPNKFGYYQGEANKFYLIAEGSDSNFPSVIEVEFTPKVGLTKTDELSFEYPGAVKEDMFTHHGDFHATKPLMYVGSGEGQLFIINYLNNPMTIEKRVDVGSGAGHACMVPQTNRAVVINHSDTYVSIMDLNTDTKIADVTVSTSDTPNQAHMNYHSSFDGRYFYAFVTSDGILYELDLLALQVTRKLDVGGQPAQGSFIQVKAP
ncbi:MAG: hypothetical protein U9Q40_07105 [Campylobacterota bacterium]|nr:hypothetical protein [Campylobacterota bacterium]